MHKGINMILPDLPLDTIHNLKELNAESKKRVFKLLHSYIKPKPEELKWTAILWEVDVWEARKEAANGYGFSSL